MKKFLPLFVLLSSLLHASPVGNPSFPRILQKGFFIPSDVWINARVGYEGDFIYDGRLKQEIESSGRVDNYKQFTNSATTTLNILDRLDLYGVFGSSQTRAEWRFTTAAGVLHNVNMETHYNFLWGIGARALLLEWGKTNLGMGGRYSSCNYKPVWLTIDGANESVAGTHAMWKEWQVNLDVSYEIDLFIPYIGVKYSSATTKLGTFHTAISSNGSGKNHFTNRVPVGLYLGCTLSTGKYFMLNVEGRLIDEEAVTVSGDVRF